jgi:hypothetical protein
MATAKKILEDCEYTDGYQKACAASPVNSLSRKNMLYTPFFVPPYDQDRLSKYTYRIDLLNGADIVILHSSADNGYPHTRAPAVVCLPEAFVVNATDESLMETLRHEAIHIHQRKYPDLWKQRLVTDGWTPLSSENLPKRFRDRCRINPDTMKCPFWAWQSYHVPLPMFKEAESLTLGDVRIEWFDTRTGALFHEPPISFTTRYGSPSQPEHPYEVYAVQYAAEGISSYSALYSKLIEP